MKFEIKKFVPQQTLPRRPSPSCPTRDVMPVLKCFQFNVDPQRLRVIASDMEMTLIATTPMVSVTWPGVAVFPARKLLDIVKSAEDADVTIHVTAPPPASSSAAPHGHCNSPAATTTRRMPAITEAEFTRRPGSLHRRDPAPCATPPAATPAAPTSTSSTSPTANSPPATASRIQQIRFAEFPISLRIPIIAVDDLLRLLKISELDTIYVGQSENKLIFRFGPDVFIVSKFFAQFPDMEAPCCAPPWRTGTASTSTRADLLAAIRRVRINADAESSGHRPAPGHAASSPSSPRTSSATPPPRPSSVILRGPARDHRGQPQVPHRHDQHPRRPTT